MPNHSSRRATATGRTAARTAGTSGLDATKQNETRALEMEFEYRQALREGRRPSQKIVVRQFSDAAKEFLDWAEGNYREHPNSYDRVATSFASHKEFFGTEPVSLIDAARVEVYKTWRIRERGASSHLAPRPACFI